MTKCDRLTESCRRNDKRYASRRRLRTTFRDSRSGNGLDEAAHYRSTKIQLPRPGKGKALTAFDPPGSFSRSNRSTSARRRTNAVRCRATACTDVRRRVSERAGKSRHEPAPQSSLFTDGALPLVAFPKRKHTPLRRDRFGRCESTTRNLRLPALQSGKLASLFADASESGERDAGRGGSSASLNLVCDRCGHKFFSAAAQDMIGKPCPQTGCGGGLRSLGRKLR